MKFTSLAILLASAAAVCKAVPTTTPAPGETVADGLWIESVDAAGNVKVDFTPHHEIVNSTSFQATDVQFKQRSESIGVEKRREDCHRNPLARIPQAVIDDANRLLLTTLPRDQYAFQGARSFICAFPAGWRYKSSIAGTWDWVKRVKCGADRLGYAQVLDGEGDWIAGYTFDGDKFCWK